MEIIDSRALKGIDAFGERVKSRVECPQGLVLQNGHTVSDNQEIARELVPVWTPNPAPGTDVVRRYQLEPTHIRDVATGWTSSQRDALTGESLHHLLSMRVDLMADEVGDAPPP